MLRALYLVLTFCSVAMLVSPQEIFELAGVEPPVSEGMARMIGFGGMFLFFALFSGPSKFGAEEAVERPQVPVEHLLPKVPKHLAGRLPDQELLSRVVGLIVEKRKIAAIKAVRVATLMDLKQAKEFVEQLQDAIR